MVDLYRYQSKKYNDGLLNDGNLRVGTLYDFRKSEHKRGIADSSEGKKTVFHKLDFFSSEAFDPIGRKALKDFGIANVEGAKNFIMSGFIFERVIESPDCFVFCMSSLLSSSMYQEFEGSETCVCIENPWSFFYRLTYAIGQIIPVDFKGLFNVEYTDEAELWNLNDWGEAPAYKKTTNFRAQHEVRAIWVPRNPGEIEPLIINDKKLRRFVYQCM